MPVYPVAGFLPRLFDIFKVSDEALSLLAEGLAEAVNCTSLSSDRLAFSASVARCFRDRLLSRFFRSPFPLQAHGMINLCDRLHCPLRRSHFFG